jgi:hypothetical protein
MRPLALIVSAALAAAGAADAIAAQESQPGHSRSPGAARAFSVLGTAAPITLAVLGTGDFRVLGAAGIVFGPMLGYVYASEPGLGARYALGRLSVLGGTAGGAALLCSVGDCSLGLFGGQEGGELLPATILLTAGIVTTTVLAAADIRRVGRKVEARNQGLGSVTLHPTVSPDARSAGLQVTLRL